MNEISYKLLSHQEKERRIIRKCGGSNTGACTEVGDALEECNFK
jgi:hypothetical protein